MTARLAVPPSMPHTAMRAAWLDWAAMPQSQSVNPAYLTIRAGATRIDEWPSGAAARRWYDLPAGTRTLSFETWCSPRNGAGWCNWPAHLQELRGATLELAESGEPGATVGGALLAPGAHAGVVPLEVRATDGDSGVRRVAATLGGTPVGTVSAACRDDGLRPCPPSLRAAVDVDTRAVADGAHRLRVVVTDAAGNERTLDAGPVLVRNQPPAPYVPPTPPPSAPTVPATTGQPRRPFPPNPLAGRGHVRNGTNASERARIRAWLEPGGRRRTRHATVPPGVRVRIRGTLTAPGGRPIGRATLAAIRRQRGGAWKPITGVRTRPNGRFTAFTRIGPSQQVRFVYYAYGDSETGRGSRTLRVTVMRR